MSQARQVNKVGTRCRECVGEGNCDTNSFDFGSREVRSTEQMVLEMVHDCIKIDVTTEV